MQQMPKIQQYHQTAGRRVDPYDNPVAVHLMGVRHHAVVPNSGVTAKITNSGHRLLHKMGGS